jgi:hypothetical protein
MTYKIFLVACAFGVLVGTGTVIQGNQGGGIGTAWTDCAYNFSSGAGATRISYCVSAQGTMPQFEAPAGQEHIQTGDQDLIEGYFICSGDGDALAGDTSGWDLGLDIGPGTVISGPTSTGVGIRRRGPQWQVDNVYKLDKKERDVTITMTLTNISSAMVPDVRLARIVDIDTDNDGGDEIYDRTNRGFSARDDDERDAVALSGTTWNVPTSVFIGTPAGNCVPGGFATPTGLADHWGSKVIYHLGNIGPGAKKTVEFVYRVQ